MAVNSRFFGGGSYSAPQLAAVIARYLGDGIRQGVNNELNCYANGSDLNVRTKTGEGFVQGYWVENTAEIVTAISPDATQDRWDRMVLHLDTATPSITIIKIDGTPGSGNKPALTRSGTVYEVSLCAILAPAAAATIPAANVYDERQASDASGPEIAWLTNKSGATRVIGEVVVVETTTTNQAFKTTTIARDQAVIGVIADVEIITEAIGRVMTHGVGLVWADAAVTRGQWLVASTTAGQATPKTNREIGSFALALQTTSASGLVMALVMTPPVAGTATATANMPAAYDGSDARVGDSDKLDGQHGSYYQNAGNLNAGTVPLAQIPAVLTGKDADTLDGLHAADLLVGGIIPGAVILWDGTLGGSDGHRPMVGGVANEGWHLMNGETVGGVLCRDLRGRFPIGAGGTYAVGDSGGAETKNLSHHHAPGTFAASPHTHTLPLHAHNVSLLTEGSIEWLRVEGGVTGYCATTGHAHVIYGDTAVSSLNMTDPSAAAAVTGTSAYAGSAAQDIMPPYMGMFYLKKLA